ncbi:MAG TPA: fibrobacter succinogenes major paralogous domain-containing protein [Paludibacteraceae bacterium]|nr:fibrobacter succinogenes major paralogous domain-containing protein [Paludibacteraceae bacterium]HPW96732.1 fibrobacter succinogenes major paralogous domain-containing protein [Paludibacteraceae bacterium]
MKIRNYIVLIISASLALTACKKEPDYSVPVDGDGNKYATVVIGSQVWMVGELRTTTLNDGTPLKQLKGADWKAPTSPAYCYYNDDESNGAVYGALYNFAAVNTGLLAPKGWHVATHEDWNKLAAYLGGLSQAGGKLKATHTWLSPNEGATNESGLALLPTGYRDADGTCEGIGKVGYWWTATIAPGGDQAWMRTLSNISAKLDGNSSAFTLGFAVLCVKDDL